MELRAIIVVLILLSAGKSKAQVPYQIKSAKIEIEYDLGFSKGTKTLIFSDSGKVEKIVGRQVIDTSVNSILPSNFKLTEKQIINILIIQTRDSLYSVNLDSMTGSARRRWNIDLGFVNSDDRLVGEEIFLGKKCQVWEFA